VLHGELAPARRAELHAAAARALLDRAAGDPDAPLAEPVHHLFAAAPRVPADEAIRWARVAAARAGARLAFDEAAGFLARAVDALPDAPERAAERCDLLLDLAHAKIGAGHDTLGRDAALAAAALARRLGDAERLARAALGFGEVFHLGFVDPHLVALVEEALAALPPGDGELRARLLARLAAALQPARDPDHPVGLARDAIAMARRAASEPARLEVLLAGTSAMSYFAEPAERAGLDRELVELAGRLGNGVRELRGWLRLVFDHLELGDVARADAAIEEIARLARRLGLPTLAWQAPLLRAMRAVMRGAFAEAEALADEARARGARVEDRNLPRGLAMHRLGLLATATRTDELATHAPEVLRDHVGALDVWYVRALAAMVQARLGRGAETRAALAAVEADLAPMAGRVSLAWAAEACVEVGDARLAAAIEPMLAPLAHRCHAWGALSMMCEGSIAHPLARLRALMGRLDDARRDFADALARAEAMDAPPHAARLQLDLAGVLAARGSARERDEARTLAGAAGDIAARLGMPGLEAAAARLLAELPETAPPALRPPASAAAPPPPVFTLAREGEVWVVTTGDGVFRLKDSRGLQILARLVAEPGREHHVTDLLAPPGEAGHVEDAGDALDATAIARYRARASELRDELAEAEAWNDGARAERARVELEAIAAELARGVGLGGRARKAASTTEKARVNVRQRLLDAIARIGEHDPALAERLRGAVKTGTFCSYHPEKR
jgi:hypothetical protein